MHSPHDRPLIRGDRDALLHHFQHRFAEASQVWITVAFVLDAGVDLIEGFLLDLLAHKEHRLRLITGDYFDVTEPRGLERLLDLGAQHPDQVDLRVFETQGQGGRVAFHPKAWLFFGEHAKPLVAFVGSSNLSRSALGVRGRDGRALGGGIEWNYRIVGSEEARGFADLQQAYEQLAEHERVRPLTFDWVQDYRARRRPGRRELREAQVGVASEESDAPTPHPIQLQALAALRQARAAGHKSGLVVLATGLGKTWLAAFDSEAFAREEREQAAAVGESDAQLTGQPTGEPGDSGKNPVGEEQPGAGTAPRILFVAHREEILDQAMATFRRVRPGAVLGRFTGKEKNPRAEILFASIQTLGRSHHLESFERDHFDYIIVDEFHHACARTYRALIEYFTPSFLLGLTATPERTDGGDLLALCGHNLVFRRDVPSGIEAGLLSPFRYHGVPDDIDYSAIPWRRTSGRFDEMELTRALATEARAQNALEQWQRLALPESSADATLEPQSPRRPRGLGFCCSIGHAQYMAEFFTAAGVPSVAVHSDAETSAHRPSALLDLREGRLELIFSVDMFNEGVDLPNLDAVMMLRPTESKILWLQQFGRGLRRDPDNPAKVLTVIDYIGNHQIFRTKIQGMLTMVLATSAGNVELRRAFEALRQGQSPLPPGCDITYDLIPVAILDQLFPKLQSEDLLRESYLEFRMQHDRRPTARELATNGAFTRSTLKRAYGSWFDLVAAMGDLTYAEKTLLQQHAEFFRYIESAKMLRSYKMLVLLAMLEEQALPGSIALPLLAQRFEQIANRTPALQVELQESLEPEGSTLLSMLRTNPLRAWAETKRGGQSDFFTLDKDTFATRFHLIAPPDSDPSTQVAGAEQRTDFAEMAHELIDWRLAEHLDRTQPPSTPAPPSPTSPDTLTLGRTYMREDIPAFFGAQFNTSTWRQGIVSIDRGLVLLVTLDKGKAQEAHRYKDHFTSPTHFTWQTQNQTTRTGKHGNLIQNHKSLGKEIHLFVRKRPKLPNSKAAPFYYCGELDFQSWHGEKPITVEWWVQASLPDALAGLML